MTEKSQTIQLPSNESAIALAGTNEQNLKLLSRHTGVQLILRGQDLLVKGQDKAVTRCTTAINTLQPLWSVGKSLYEPDILTAFQAIDTGRTLNLKKRSSRNRLRATQSIR